MKFVREHGIEAEGAACAGASSNRGALARCGWRSVHGVRRKHRSRLPELCRVEVHTQLGSVRQHREHPQGGAPSTLDRARAAGGLVGAA
jgi:hypothetical protein